MKYLARVRWDVETSPGEYFTYYNNLYATTTRETALVGVTDAGVAIWEWTSIEIDPRTGGTRLYNQDVFGIDPDNPNNPLIRTGEIETNGNIFDEIKTKTALIVRVEDGDEITI